MKEKPSFEGRRKFLRHIGAVAAGVAIGGLASASAGAHADQDRAANENGLSLETQKQIAKIEKEMLNDLRSDLYINLIAKKQLPPLENLAEKHYERMRQEASIHAALGTVAVGAAVSGAGLLKDVVAKEDKDGKTDPLALVAGAGVAIASAAQSSRSHIENIKAAQTNVRSWLNKLFQDERYTRVDAVRKAIEQKVARLGDSRPIG